MCWCTPSIRTPVCGKLTCRPPGSKFGKRMAKTAKQKAVDFTMGGLRPRKDQLSNAVYREVCLEVARLCNLEADAALERMKSQDGHKTTEYD